MNSSFSAASCQWRVMLTPVPCSFQRLSAASKPGRGNSVQEMICCQNGAVGRGSGSFSCRSHCCSRLSSVKAERNKEGEVSKGSLINNRCLIHDTIMGLDSVPGMEMRPFLSFIPFVPHAGDRPKKQEMKQVSSGGRGANLAGLPCPTVLDLS